MRIADTMFASVAFLGVAGYVLFTDFSGGEATSALAPGRFVVSNDRYRFEYSLEARETTTSGALTMTGAQAGVSEGGAALTLHYLTDDSVSDYRRNQNPRTCSAPFFNRYAKQKILIPASPAIERQLRAVEIPNYQDVASWRPFTLRGYCIRAAPVIQKDGQPAQMPGNMFDNCLTMVATRLEVGDRPVVDASAAR